MRAKTGSASLLMVWLAAAQLAQAWLIFDVVPEATALLAGHSGHEALPGAVVAIISFSDEVRGEPLVWVSVWILLVGGFAWASFRGRHWSVRMAVAFLALLQLTAVIWARQTLADECERLGVVGHSQSHPLQITADANAGAPDASWSARARATARSEQA